jgi:predicted dehydrogenase
MNFALLGDDPGVLPLVRSIAADSNHQLTHAAGMTATLADVMKLAPSVRVVPQWDELLLDNALNAVIVAGSDEGVLEGAKQLASAGKALLVFPVAGQGSTWIYELTLIRDDTRVMLFPVFAARVHPQLCRVRDIISGTEIGTVLHLQIEREVHVADESSSTPLLSSADVDEALLPDVDLFRNLGGDYNRITALHSGKTSGGISLATVTLAGENLPEASWSLKATTAETTWQLTVAADKGRLVISGGNDASAITVEGDIATDESNNTDFDLGAAILDRFEAAMSGDRVRPDWTDLTCVFELVEATHQSIRRRRTIDLHFEIPSERSLFKTQMTAIGCGLLGVTFFAVLVVLTIGTLLDPRGNVEFTAGSADTIVFQDHFSGKSATLTAEGSQHLEKIGGQMSKGTFQILIEQCENNSDPELDQLRRKAVVDVLSKKGARDAEKRTVVFPLRGKWFSLLMRIARILVFLPLAVFLLLQLLLFVARPSASQSPVNDL